MLALQEMVEHECLQDRVEFLGAVPHVNVRDVLVRGHVFLNCSLTESFCIAILEAASCGLLVVSTNVGGVPEVLPEDAIFLADPNVPDMVLNVMLAVERQRGDAPIDPVKMHERVKKMYSWERVAKETESVYDAVVKMERRTFQQRLACFRSLGGSAGLVAALLVCILQVWLRVVEWMWPADQIDRVPDLTGSEQKSRKQD